MTIGFRPSAVTNPVEPEAPLTKVESSVGFVRNIVSGSKQGQVRRLALYAVTLVALMGAVAWAPSALVGGVALMLLIGTDRDV